MDIIKNRIISGLYKPGDKIDTVRDFAVNMGVNPNTMQRALGELEREGYLYSERTTGRFITQDKKFINKLKNEKLKMTIKQFLDDMYTLGMSDQEILTELTSIMEAGICF